MHIKNNLNCSKAIPKIKRTHLGTLSGAIKRAAIYREVSACYDQGIHGSE